MTPPPPPTPPPAPAPPPDDEPGTPLTRREAARFTVKGVLLLSVAWGALASTGALLLAAMQSFFVPRLSLEPPSLFPAGRLADYPTPGVYEDFKASHSIWIVHLPGGRLIALSTLCTHLGCIPNWQAGEGKFKCPCHGSGFYEDGINFEGPAPRPLERYRVLRQGDTLWVDTARVFRQELGQWDDPQSFVTV